MALDFPASPTVGQKYPASPIAGVPTYSWDGEKWTTIGGAVMGANAVCYDIVQSLTAPQQQQARQNVYAAPFDAMAYSGLQINGACEVDQPAAGNVQLTNNAAYFTDSWVLVSLGVLNTLASSNDVSLGFPNGFSKYVRIYTVTPAASLAASDLGVLQTRIEGYRTARLQWGTASAQPITIGFWVINSASTNLTMTVAVQNNGATRTYLVDVPITNGWTYHTVTIPGDTSGTWLTTNGMGMAITFCFGGGANSRGTANAWNAGNFEATAQTSNLFTAAGNQAAITGVIVLPGNEAPSAARSPFVMRPYDQELIQCMRYYERVGMTITALSPPYFNTSWFKVVKRTTPTITLLLGGVNGATLGLAGTGSQLNHIRQITAASGPIDAEFAIDARL